MVSGCSAVQGSLCSAVRCSAAQCGAVQCGAVLGVAVVTSAWCQAADRCHWWQAVSKWRQAVADCSRNAVGSVTAGRGGQQGVL